MSKEVKLEDLIKNASPVKTETKEEEVVVSKPEVNIVPGQEISIDEIAKTLPGKEKEEIKNPEIVDNAFSSMHNILNEKKRFIEEEVMPIVKHNAEEMAMENEMNELGIEDTEDKEENDSDFLDDLDDDTDDEEPVVVNETKNEEVKKVISLDGKLEAKNQITDLDEETSTIDSLLDDIEEDIDEDDFSVVDGDEEESVEETRARLKKNIGSMIKSSNDTIDFSKFTIETKPVANSLVLSNIISDHTKKTADWVLYNTNKTITMSEASGPELEALSKTIRNSNSINSAIASIRLVYNHIIDANKPSFETWTKLVRTEDLDSLYYALYRACYADTNLVGYTCDKKTDGNGCGKTSIINVDINDMVKYADEETEAKFKDMLQHDTTTYKTEIKSSLMAISDKIAISYSEPTLYSTLIQFSALKPEIIEKYNELLNTMAYIDNFYYIDDVTHKLQPFQIKTYPNNLNKTILSKLKLYAEILKTLTPDEYDIAIAKLNNIGEESKISYILPEAKCPECGCTIEEQPAGSMLDLVFTRRQLAQIRGL